MAALALDAHHGPSSVFRPRADASRSRRRSRSSGRRARGRRPCCARSRGSCGRRAGRIACDGDDLVRRGARASTLPPDRRRVGLVFQDYALFPHMTVRQNVEYARTARADEYLERFRDRATSQHARPASSRAASASASRSRARSRATRRCCCSTSRSPRSTRTRSAVVRAELQELLARARPAGAARHARLRGRRRARRPGRRDRRRAAPPDRHAGRARRARRPTRSSRRSPARTCCTATPSASATLTRVRLDDGTVDRDRRARRTATSSSRSTRGT